jgi:hypothetical protein
MLRYFIIEVRRLRADPEDQRRSLLHQREIREEERGNYSLPGKFIKEERGKYSLRRNQRGGEGE